MSDGAPTENADLDGQVAAQEGDKLWTDLARDAYRSSQDYFNSSLRREFEDATAHFQSRHAPGSKYLHPSYRKKSKFFRPKTRATVRNNEMAVAVALFSTQDVVHITPVNDSDKEQVKACAVKNHILNYRLSQPDMNWFTTAIGGAQEAMSMGSVVSKQGWKFTERPRLTAGRPVMQKDGTYVVDAAGSMEVVADYPTVDLVPLENIRLHPGADWRDPIQGSPYIIELVPMTVAEVRRMAKEEDPLNPGEMLYREVDNIVLRASAERDWESVRRIREGERVDKYETGEDRINDFKTVWVHKNIVRLDGYDWCFDTLGPNWMLSTRARPIEEVTLLGERPYTYGVSAIEAHKLHPGGIPKLTFESQEYANDIANLRQDNLRLALNKRFWVRRGAQVDILSLKRNVAGGVTLMNNPDGDVKESSTPDVTGSSYEEQDRLNADFDEVAGSFSSSSVNTNRHLNETVGGMEMMGSSASMMQEYMVRTVVETWFERTLRQVMKLIENYESDLDLLKTVAAKFNVQPEQQQGAPVQQDQASMDAREVLRLLQLPTELRVNVGFGATNPMKRVEKLGLGLGTIQKYFPETMQEADQKEIVSEVFGALGYRDGARFLPHLYADQGDMDPQLVQALEENAQLKQMIESGVALEQAKAQAKNINIEAEGQVKLMLERVKQETAMLKEQYKNDQEGYKAAMKQRMDSIEARLNVAKEERERMSLALEREALSHAILQDDREFALQMREKKSETDGAHNLEGDDGAGVISRQDYGLMPDSPR